MGFYSFEDLKEKENGEKRDILEQNGACKDDLSGKNEAKTELESYIFDTKNRSKVDELVVEARKLKHNICDWNYDFLGKYRVEAVEAEHLRAVLDDYILLVGLLEKG